MSTQIGWDRAIIALVKHGKVSEATAIEAGVTQRTLYRLLKKPDFVERYHKASDAFVADSLKVAAAGTTVGDGKGER